MRVTVGNTHPLLTSLSQDDDNASLPFTSRTSHSLHQADGILLCIEANNEVHLSDIQPLLPDTGRHQCVEASLSELVHYLKQKRTIDLKLHRQSAEINYNARQSEIKSMKHYRYWFCLFCTVHSCSTTIWDLNETCQLENWTWPQKGENKKSFKWYLNFQMIQIFLTKKVLWQLLLKF